MFTCKLMRVMMIYDAFTFHQKQHSLSEGSYRVPYSMTELKSSSLFLVAKPNINVILKRVVDF